MTTLHPEQQRAMAYLARKGSAATAETLRSEMRHAFASTEDLFARVLPEARDWAPAPGKWSAVEILDHLVLSHDPAIDQLSRLLRGETPGGVAIPAGLSSPAAERPEWSDLSERLRSVHSWLLAAVELAHDGLSLEPKAVVEMVVKVPDESGALAPTHWYEKLDWKAFVQSIRVHTLEHRAQLERVMGAWEERLSRGANS